MEGAINAGGMSGSPVAGSPVAGRKKGISGSTLKLIAIITMLIDHICAVVFTRVLIDRGMYDIMYQSMEAQMEWVLENPLYYVVYLLRMTVGRMAFPIFCFLLAEGIQKTGNVGKYALRLGLFALVSEIPFDLALSSKPLELRYQNVFFTLFLGLLVLIAIQWIEKQNWHPAVRTLLMLVALAAGMAAGKLLHSDYDAMGVLLIAALYLCRYRRYWQVLAGFVILIPGTYILMGNLSEVMAMLAFIPIAFYNGERGLRLKYVFYLFYPVHLLILYLICVFMGLGAISAL